MSKFNHCTGTNCKAVNGVGHSYECTFEHETANTNVGSPGTRHPEYRYAGYVGRPLSHRATKDEAKAHAEGVAAQGR